LNRARHFFPGSNTPQGFFSYYDHILPHEKAERIIILKGGPGTGKSTLMKRLADDWERRGLTVEHHHCSADPGSLDAVALPEAGVAVVDGTRPHTIDPRFPGAVDEIVHLGEYWDEEGIRRHRDEIAALSALSSQAYQRAYRYLAASRLVYEEVVAIHSRALDLGRLNQMAQALIARCLSTRPAAAVPGPVRRLFASAITPRGHVHFVDRLAAGASRVVVIQGPPGTGKSTLVEKLAQEASRQGIAVECFHSPYDPVRVDHLVAPELDLAVITSAPPYLWAGSAEEVVDTREALLEERLQPHREELKEAEQQALRLLEIAIRSLAQAKAYHDQLEQYYVPHMDFPAMEELYQRLRRKLEAHLDRLVTP